MAQSVKHSTTCKPSPEPLGGLALPIYSVTPFTMLDFPGKCAAIVWFSGCNMRCGYCHNPQIVKGKGTQDIEELIKFLKKRQGLLDGIVLSGGEATLYPGLPAFVRIAKDLGYAIKLDTNGTRPKIVKQFLEEGLLDYVALDYKAPAHKFKAVAGITRFNDFEETLSMLCTQTRVPFEVRTTVHTALMNEDDVNHIINDLNDKQYKGTYYVQNYVNNDGPTLASLPPQKNEIDMGRITVSNGIIVAFRNL